ncbi:TPA: calcium/sodium antiporter [Pseudomonas aeruginosa]|uniref:calcium/sodium antiporter n=1 Tax=Pseudomonas aeruginosa TaxID=287 RepID=UPI000F52E10C|nr:calcium/sodium antiporter [Pseudomonas aeruginosa]MCO2027312.1 calcium/sodium antiporter [Pseudomonas aeruginosa]RPV85255.1 sodium:calcium antiporter [Pseudomonas aeruginosa]WPM38957.1 calcium/sodium antiporter [Pseudomonas aeruginosa]HBO1748713.1 calcium/sodium antiporter [Pseudomonas aeruginosa]HBO8808227.1 calcium/sodium antiporter [Pseudomonas aeruginosa]
MFDHILLLLLGFVILVAGADLLVRGASRLAVSMGISPLVVGLTVVAFGTSAPELAVSVDATLAGSSDLAIGNVVGGNIAKVLLILGISALITPLVVSEQVIRQEIPIMIGASLLLVVMTLDGSISRIESSFLLSLIVAYTAFLIHQSRSVSKMAKSQFTSEIPTSNWDRHWSVQIALIAASLGMLVLGADWLVVSAEAVAKAYGVSDLVIGLTIVAIGTSMPEMAASVVAGLRGQGDIAVGNVLGSNVFNIFAVIGASGLVASGSLPVPETARNFDLWVMLAVAFACLPILTTGRNIARWEGGLLLAYYAIYIAWLVLSIQQATLLTAFSNVMLSYVIPLTVIALLISVVRHFRRTSRS